MRSLTIVIPAFNEEQRLPRTVAALQSIEPELQGFALQEVIVVDDGSADETAAWVTLAARSWDKLKILILSPNQGKGAAVRHGMQAAQAEWILIADADMATPWTELNKFASYLSDYDLIMGSRALAESRIMVRQHILRQTMGRIFNKVLKSIVGLPYHDTQCGFKLCRNDEDFRRQILPRLQVNRFAWDAELILVVRKFKKRILESPIEWSHQEASRVRIVRDSLEMLWATVKMRLRGL